MTIKQLPTSIEATLDLLAKADYIADRSLATVLYLALRMGRPLFVEGEAGVGKTEIAKVLSSALGRRLIRLQCYEGLDISSAVYEWNYGAQMIAIRLAEAQGEGDRERIEHDVFSERFLIKRPLLQALDPDPAGPPVLLLHVCTISPTSHPGMAPRTRPHVENRRTDERRSADAHHRCRGAHRPCASEGRRPAAGARFLLRRAGFFAHHQPARRRLYFGRRLPPPSRAQHLGEPGRLSPTSRQHRPLPYRHSLPDPATARRRAAPADRRQDPA